MMLVSYPDSYSLFAEGYRVPSCALAEPGFDVSVREAGGPDIRVRADIRHQTLTEVNKSNRQVVNTAGIHVNV